MKLAKLFQGKDNPKEEMKEAKAVKAGKVTPKQYARGEKMEGDKKPMKTLEKTARDMKAGKLSPSRYAKGGK
jgi:hypothetical protein